MITERKFEIFQRFAGDEDGWSRAGCPGGEEFEERDWNDIRNLLQELTPLKKGLVSPEYAKRIHQRLDTLSASPQVKQILLESA